MGEPTIADTVALALHAHGGQTDKKGRPYMRHLLKVVSNLPEGPTDDHVHVALLHDIIEDTDMDTQGLADFGYPQHIIDSVDRLTHRKGEVTYHDYIKGIFYSKDELAIDVKKADNKTNLEDVDDVFPDGWMRERYEKSLRILEGDF